MVRCRPACAQECNQKQQQQQQQQQQQWGSEQGRAVKQDQLWQEHQQHVFLLSCGQQRLAIPHRRVEMYWRLPGTQFNRVAAAGIQLYCSN
jgi:hypothetical protein